MIVINATHVGTRQGLRLGMILAAALLVLLGCSTPAAPAAPAPPSNANPAPPAPAAPSAPAPATLQDAALRLQLLLGQHAVLAADMMRGRIRNDEDFGQAASAAIGRNSDDMAQLIAGLFDNQAAEKFRTLWADHVTALFNYSRGLATNDQAAREDARRALIGFETEIGSFFSAAAQGRLPAAAAQSAITTHVDHLLEQADAYAARDYQRANSLYREGYSHTYGIGTALASTLLPPTEAAKLADPQWRLRSELSRLLGEHVSLAVAALRAGATDAPDFSAAAAALNANSSDLSGAIGTLFGPPAGAQFSELWADHIDGLVAYTAGVAAQDPGRRDAALAGLRDFEGRMGEFLASATGDRLGSPDLGKALFSHDDMLLRGVDAFVAKDYQQYNDISYSCYQEMAGISRQLSDAFGPAVAARLPQGGASTGFGGTAPR